MSSTVLWLLWGQCSLATPVSIPDRPPDRVAQRPDPNRDRLIPSPPAQAIPEPSPTVQPRPTVQPSPSPPPSPTQPTPAPATRSFQVNRVEITGSTVFGSREFQPIKQSLEGRSVTPAELQQAATRITQLYLDKGYLTTLALDPTIDANGTVRIQVSEGAIGEIKIEGNRRVSQAYIRDRIRLGTTTPLRQDRLEDQLRLLKSDPLFSNVEASLRASGQRGKSDLTVRVMEAPPLSGFVGVDNYSPPSVGSVRFGVGFNYRNPIGLGDQLSGSYYRTNTGGADSFDFSYSVPINSMDGRLQFRAAPNQNRITDRAFRNLDIAGSTNLFDFNYRQPIIRNPRQEFALSIGLSFQDGQTFLFQDIPFPFGIGPDSDGRSKTRVLRFAQDYTKRDVSGAWSLRSQFNLGLNILNATRNDAPIPDGRFFSWQGQFQRVQRLGNNNLLIASFDTQLTPDSLLPSQQFVIGGGQSIRGFRQNARSGDNGFRFSVEDRIAIQRSEAGIPTLQLAPFVDVGKIWNRSGNPNQLPEQTLLAAAGLGILWQPVTRLTVRLDYAVPFLKLDDRGSNIQDQGFTFSVYYQF